MRAVAAGGTSALTLALLLTGCTGGDGGAAQDPGSDDDATTAPARLDPATVLAPIRDALTGAGSVVVTRTALDSADTTGPGLHEDLEVDFSDPVSARVLHVGEEIWTLDVVEGVGYLKDQTDRKSTNRWRELSPEQTAERLAGVTVEGLLGGATAATEVEAGQRDTVRGQQATCHTFTVPAAPPEEVQPGTARLCVDGQQRPVEVVVTRGTTVTTSVFTAWGFDVAALAPPPGLIDPVAD